MENLSLEMTPAMMVLVPMVAALIQFVKKIPQFESYNQWLPIVSLALGVGAAYLQNLPNPIMAGIIIGLTASGAYDVLKGKKDKE